MLLSIIVLCYLKMSNCYKCRKDKLTLTSRRFMHSSQEQNFLFILKNIVPVNSFVLKGIKLHSSLFCLAAVKSTLEDSVAVTPYCSCNLYRQRVITQTTGEVAQNTCRTSALNLQIKIDADSSQTHKFPSTHFFMATSSPDSKLRPRMTEPQVPSPSCLMVVYLFITLVHLQHPPGGR